MSDPSLRVIEPIPEWTWTGSLICGDVLAGIAFITFPLLTFYGSKFFNASLAFSATTASAFLTYLLIGYYAHLNPMMEAILVCVAGACAAIAALSVADVGIFVLGAMAGALAANLVLHFLRIPLDYIVDAIWFKLLFVLAPAVLFGIVAVTALHYSIRLITSFVGSYFLVASLSRFLWRLGASESAPFDPPTFFGPFDITGRTVNQGGAPNNISAALTYSLLAVWLILSIIGLVSQYHTSYEYKPIAERISVNGAEYRRIHINDDMNDPQQLIHAHSSYQSQH